MNTTTTNPYRFKPGVGSVSHGTMRAQDLIPAFLDTLASLDKAQADSIRNNPDNKPIFDWLDSDCETEPETDYAVSLAEAADFLIEELMDCLNGFAPAGLYFGAHEGDGSDYGFWPGDLDDCHFDGFKSVKSLSDAAKLGIETDPEDSTYPPLAYRGEWLHVNDHGNCTLYVRDDNGDHEVWSCV